MQFLTRLVGRAKPVRAWRKRTSALSRSASPGLTLEALEERWTPAVSITITNDHLVNIEDSSSGKTSNTIEIIDNYIDHNTYIKINGGALTKLNTNAGANGYLQNLNINMQGGDDKVIFTTTGIGALDHDLERSVVLGEGKDTFSLSLNKNLGGHEVAFTVWGLEGNDKYSFAGSFSEGTVSLNLIDHEGSDGYDISHGYLYNAMFNVSVVDVDGGTNKFKLSHGNVYQGYVEVEVAFLGDATNTVVFSGNATLTHGGVSVDVTGGDGKDTIEFDDNSASATESVYFFDLGKGNDVVTAVIDGNKSTTGGMFAGAITGLNVDLGDGNDSFTATVYGKYWQADTQGSGNMAGAAFSVDGGIGKDTIKVAPADSNAINLRGPEAYLWSAIKGGSEADTIKVDVGKIVSDQPLDATVMIRIDAGLGADKVSVLGSFGDTPGMDLALDVKLGAGDGKDTLTIALISASGATLKPNFWSGSQITGGLDDVIDVSGTFFGKKITEWVPPSLS